MTEGCDYDYGVVPHCEHDACGEALDDASGLWLPICTDCLVPALRRGVIVRRSP